MRALVLVALVGCGCGHALPGPGDASFDAASHIDAALPDQLIADLADPFDAGPCILSHTTVNGSGPILVGALCDTLELCAPDEPSAQAVMTVAPRFTCTASQNDACPFRCDWEWHDRGTAIITDPDEVTICAITELPFQPTITCYQLI